MIELDDLRAFARIADLKSISAAARALNIPKSSASRSLARLEATVGTGLVERSTRHLRLTDSGALFYPYALRILVDVEEAEAALSGFGGEPRGVLRVNAPYAFAQGLLAPMLPVFLSRYPKVQLQVDVTDRQIDMPVEEADLVIRVGPLPASTLIARRLTTIALWACASPAYLAARGTPYSVADLRGHDLIGRVGRTLKWAAAGSEAEGNDLAVSPRAIIHEPTTVRIMLEGGAGIGRLPDFIAADAIAKGDLARVLPDIAPDMIEVHALYPSHRSLSAKVRAFLDMLAGHLAKRSFR